MLIAIAICSGAFQRQNIYMKWILTIDKLLLWHILSYYCCFGLYFNYLIKKDKSREFPGFINIPGREKCPKIGRDPGIPGKGNPGMSTLPKARQRRAGTAENMAKVRDPFAEMPRTTLRKSSHVLAIKKTSLRVI